MAIEARGVSLAVDPVCFAPEDLLKIGRALVGYRHVSTEARASRELEYGMTEGCSLNISFCSGQGGQNVGVFSFKDGRLVPTVQEKSFEGLSEKILRGIDCTDEIKRYQTAITDFIENSLRFDLYEAGGWLTKALAINAFAQSRFMLVRTNEFEAVDLSSWHMLGRFRKESVPAEGLLLVEPLSLEELEPLAKDAEESPEGVESLIKSLAIRHIKNLVHCVRSEAFDPAKYNQTFGV